MPVPNTAFVNTAVICGVEAVPVTVEVSLGAGLPGISIIGLADAAVQEAKLRVRMALKAAGYDMPYQQIVVNLAPSSMRKSGAAFDLPIALGVLIATEQLPQAAVENRLCIGELSLDGAVKAVKGMLAYEMLANARKQSILTGSTNKGIYEQEQLRIDCIEHIDDIRTENFYEPAAIKRTAVCANRDFSEIVGNDVAKRALQIAASGNHGMLMIGPPGSGKSMLAHCLPSILPLLDENKRVQSALIHSIAGLPYQNVISGVQPFRAPHHSASRAGLLGGGSPPQPGEVSLAHNGVLFLDEMPEFSSAALQLLRQPMEDKLVTIARAAGTITYPANFMLIAAANPCPCGYYGDPKKPCRCNESQIRNYQNRIGGPLMDRFDIVVDVWRSDSRQVLATGSGTPSKDLLREVSAAREFKSWRSKDKNILPAKVNLTGKDAALIAECRLDNKSQDLLERLSTKYNLSGRGIMRSLALARTIADMAQNQNVLQEHLLEAINYRCEREGVDV